VLGLKPTMKGPALLSAKQITAAKVVMAKESMESEIRGVKEITAKKVVMAKEPIEPKISGVQEITKSKVVKIE